MAEGIDGDFSTLCIFNVTKRRQAFRFRGHIGVDGFYSLCAKYGIRYNRALLAPERNNHGHAVILGLEEIEHYSNLYKQVNETRLIVKKNQGIKRVQTGWLTTSTTKPLMLDQFKLALEGESEEDEHSFTPEFSIFDTMMLDELLSYMNEGGKLGASQGKHDDLIIGWSIAYQMYKLLKKREAKHSDMGILFGGSRQNAS